MANDKRPTTTFNEDDEYRQQIAKAKGGNVPLGGVPMPPIPRLDAAPPGDRFTGVQGNRNRAAADRVLTPAEREQLNNSGQMRQGVGSGYAANQPGIQQGAVEVSQPPQPGTFVNPPRPEGAGLSPKTVEGLAAVAAATKGKAAVEAAQTDDEALEKTTADINDLTDGWVTDEFGNRVRNLLNNNERREAIERRCDPMRVEDLLLNNEVRQKVPIIPTKFEPTFRSVAGHEDLFAKRRISKVSGSEQLVMDTFALMNLVMGIYSINGRLLPSHLDSTTGEPMDTLFDEKYKIVSRMPLALLADLSTNYVWFSRRVNKLMVIDDIKGF